MKTIRALIVDDEPPARQRIRELLARESDVAVVAEARNGAEAALAVTEFDPDLVFLDVQMPEVDGFGFCDLIGPDRAPFIVFVTAYDEHAIRAFEVHALDYLLKPFDRERFTRALDRARDAIAGRSTHDAGQRVGRMLADRAPRHPDRLLVKHQGRGVLVRVDDIDWIESAANYVKLHRGRETLLLRETMNTMERRLDPARFIRIHRSTIVNLDRIAHLEPYFHGDYVVKLQGGTSLSMSRTYRPGFEERLGRTL